MEAPRRRAPRQILTIGSGARLRTGAGAAGVLRSVTLDDRMERLRVEVTLPQLIPLRKRMVEVVDHRTDDDPGFSGGDEVVPAIGGTPKVRPTILLALLLKHQKENAWPLERDIRRIDPGQTSHPTTAFEAKAELEIDPIFLQRSSEPLETIEGGNTSSHPQGKGHVGSPPIPATDEDRRTRPHPEK